jgi:hypothetical protein
MENPINEWIPNPGTDSQTPDPELSPDTVVLVRFAGSPSGEQDDQGFIRQYYWAKDNCPADITHYKILVPK